MKKIYWKQDGMLTVEASFIIPLTVIIVGLTLSLLFHEYRYCWYTQAACETVLVGSSQGVLKGTSALEKAEERWNRLKNENYLIPDNFKESISEHNQKMQFICEGETIVWGKNNFYMYVYVEQKICKPVTYIRKIDLANTVVRGAYDKGV